MLANKVKPFIVHKPEHKFKTVLFLPEGEGRKGEGGLRTKGYFKHSYRLVVGDQCLVNGENRLVNSKWHICDTEGNPVKPAPKLTNKKKEKTNEKIFLTGN